MKLLRYGPAGKELPGILDSAGQIRSLVNVVEDIAGESLSPATFDQLRELNLESLPVVESPVRIGPCVGRVGKFSLRQLFFDHCGLDLGNRGFAR